MKNKAFTKMWALFCAGKEFTEEDLIYRNQVIQNGDLRQIDHRRASIRFCSVLDTSLAGSVIREGGDLTGNGWKRCSFQGADYTGLTMEQERYEDCIMGNMYFRRVRMLELQVRACNYTGSSFQDVELLDCTFENCVFRRTGFLNTVMERTAFYRCIFDEPVMENIVLSDVIFRDCFFRGWNP